MKFKPGGSKGNEKMSVYQEAAVTANRMETSNKRAATVENLAQQRMLAAQEKQAKSPDYHVCAHESSKDVNHSLSTNLQAMR